MSQARTDASLLLDALAGRQEGGFIELRWFPNGNARREFYACTDHGRERALEDALRFGNMADVFVGCAPRREQGFGGKTNIDQAWALWVDCDTPESVVKLAEFRPFPSLVVKSGTGNHMHAYWVLEHAAPARYVERCNRRLAHALGADPRCAEVARILRIPGTFNYKHEPRAEVKLIAPHPDHWSVADTTRYPLSFVADMDDPPNVRPEGPTAPRVASDDALLGISAQEYITRLTGRPIDSKGYVQCPFHEDWNPSLMAYADPKRGWHCFQCGEGGSIYDFAALLWGLGTRGADFMRVRERLTGELL